MNWLSRVGSAVFLCCLFTKISNANITATLDDFAVKCGNRKNGPMQITYQSKNPDSVYAVYINNQPMECSLRKNGSYFVMDDARNGCAIEDPGSPYPAYHAIIFLQEHPIIQRANDPKFLLSCLYMGGDVRVHTSALTVEDSVVSQQIQDFRWVVVTGYVDMAYQLGIYENDGVYNTPISAANFGDKIALKITMSGMDEDEQGVRVRDCVARSGGINATFIENFCASSPILAPGVGFVTDGTESVLSGLEAFRLAGSEDIEVTFECTLDICAYYCNGSNCVRGGGRQRRSVGDGNRTTVRISRKIKVVTEAEKKMQTVPCLQSLEFLTPISTLSVLLLITLLLLLCTVTKRQKDTVPKSQPT